MKKIFSYAIGVVLILLAGFFITNYSVKNKIKTLLDEESSLSYSSLDVNVFVGHLSLTEVEFQDQKKGIDMKLEEIQLTIEIIHYLLHDEIKIESLLTDGLDLKFTSSSSDQADQKEEKEEFDIVGIEKLDFQNSTLVYLKDEKVVFEADELNLSAENISWPLEEDFQWLDNESLLVEASRLNYNLDDLHFLKTERFTFQNKSMHLIDFAIVPKFSKTEYINHISKQKDLMTLGTKSLKISGFELYKKDSMVHTSIHKILLDSTSFTIYRDKTITNDTSRKPLYSKALRDLGFKLSVDSLLISEMNLSYQELLDKDRQPGEIEFNAIQGHVINIHNQINAKEPDIVASLKARFTKDSDISFNLSMVPDHEQFYVSTRLKQIEDKSINGFFAPAMRMEVDGKIDEISTSFSGNDSEMNGDFTIKYQKLKINVLRKDGGKNNFASLIGNVFVRNRDVDDAMELQDVDRDTTKSFWNYVWTFHLEGLKKSLL